MSNSKDFDFVIYGATGFTGKLVVEYTLDKYLDVEDLSWAIAGRNVEKLESPKLELGLPSEIEIIEVDNIRHSQIVVLDIR